MSRKGFVLLFLIVFIVCALSLEPVNAGGEDSYNVNIMSFNVRKMTADDGTPNSWDNRKNIAVNLINSFAPDVMGLQEADKAQIDYFMANCNGNFKSVGTSRLGTTINEHSNIMYRTDKYKLLDWGEFWLSETPDIPGSKSSYDTAYPRMCTWVKLQALDNPNAVFYFFNTHLSQVKEAQLQSLNIILSKISDLVTSAETPVFIGGDFNFLPYSQPYEYLKNSSFNDTWQKAGHSFDGMWTFHNFGGLEAPEGIRCHIDFIFERNVKEINSVQIITYNENGFYPSDHFPVLLNAAIPLTSDTSERPLNKYIWLKAPASNKYVSGRINTTDSPLWASASAVATWELFEVVDAGNGFIALRSKANGKYVSARINATDVPLQARAGSIGSWEKFIWIRNGDGTVSFRSIANNKYVSARDNETNKPLEARIDTIRGWEKFIWGY